jgi:hypothetical protein
MALPHLTSAAPATPVLGTLVGATAALATFLALAFLLSMLVLR